jgi:hypothetical protein
MKVQHLDYRTSVCRNPTPISSGSDEAVTKLDQESLFHTASLLPPPTTNHQTPLQSLLSHTLSNPILPPPQSGNM